MSFPPLSVLVPVALGFDEDPGSTAQLVDAACDIAHVDAMLHLVFVHRPLTPLLGFDGGLAPAAYWQSLAEVETAERELAQGQLQVLSRRVHDRHRHATFEFLGPRDGIGESIVQAATAHDVDLIVMWSHGRRALRRLLLGSVAERVARLAPMSVLILRGAPPT